MTAVLFAVLAGVALTVGIAIGAVGIGGVLLIPALEVLSPLSLRPAMATALFTFIFTGLVGTVAFQRRGSIDWRVTMPLCGGGALFGFAGAWVNARVATSGLALVLSLLILAAGVFALRGNGNEAGASPARHRSALLVFGVGSITGFGSGLTGVGGPALSVPMMVLLGFPALTSIAASQVIQVLAAASGSVANLLHGQVDFRLAAGLTLFEVAGVWFGTRLAHAVDPRVLRRAVALLCIVVGALLLARTLRTGVVA